MGTQKLLLPLRGKTVIACVVDAVLQSGVQQTLVVAGADRERIAGALVGRSVAFVTNPEPESEMLDSLRCGLRALPRECTAFLVVLGDQPSVTAELIARLIAAGRRTTRGIVVPTWMGQRGHPVLVHARFREAILGDFDAVGLRGLLCAHPAEIEEMPAPSATIMEDLDTPSDYARERGGD